MNPRARARLVDVAARAGVTVSTASRALARPHMVRPDTRARVEQAAAELAYQPNLAARTLITGRTGVIAVVVPDLSTEYYADIAKATQGAARERGYELFILDTDTDPDNETEVMRSIARLVDGVIICGPTTLGPRPGVPTVYVDQPGLGAHAVVLDQEHIASTQLDHVLELGHEHILVMQGPKNLWASEVRRAVVERYARDHPGIRISEPTPPSFDTGMKAVDLLDDEVTALIAYNDIQAFGVVRRVAEFGMLLPRWFSLMGCDGVRSSQYMLPALTTVRVPVAELGCAAVSLLLDHLSEEGPIIQETLRGRLVVRDSTGRPRRDSRPPVSLPPPWSSAPRDAP